MKKVCITFLVGLLASPGVVAQIIYDGYDAYYQTLGGIFRAKASFNIKGGENAVVSWKGQRIELKRATPFAGEFTVNDDLGNLAFAFEKAPYACVEGQSSSASGTAVRHQSVYLLDARAVKVKAYKLPSLFASCAAVRLDEQGRPLFDAAAYIYAEGSDSPAGVNLVEYVISRGKFIPTGHSVTTHFVEEENVWKFEVVAVN
jgi:hypothetical protein